MINRKFVLLNVAILFCAAAFLIPSLSPKTAGVFAQIGNSISGQVLGYEREPLYDTYVELLNEYGQSISRARTDGSGRYNFYGMPAGNYSVRVMPYGTDYEEETQSIQIVNFTRQNSSGERTTSGASREQLDFYLKIRKDLVNSRTGAIFVQQIPEPAKKLYQQAVSDLNDKKEKEGLTGLKAAIEAFPKYFLALERLGNEYVRLRYYEAAQYLFSAAIEVNPRAYRSWYGLAYSYYSLNKFDDGLFAVEKSLEIYQGSPESYLLAGILKRQKKKYEDAEKQMLKAKDLAKDSLPMVHWHLALLYGNDLKRYSDAAKELKLYLKVQTDLQEKEKIEMLIKKFEEMALKEKK